jgi:prolyl-tRNA synthetase
MQATVLDENGKPRTLMMGCYGIGITRIAAAAIEQNNDEKGIIWPAAIAPFEVVISPIHMAKSDAVRKAAESLYQSLLDAGVDVLFDDRPLRPGVMFADMELIGIPHRFVLSEKLLADNNVEYKGRRDSDATVIPIADVMQTLQLSGVRPR